MKKWVCLLLTGILLLCCAACEGTPISSGESSPLYSFFPDLGETGFTISHGTYTYTVTSTQEADMFQPTRILTITDKASGKTIQTLRFRENEWFTTDPLYLIDITFDGNIDLLVPFSRPASGVFFQAYVWDAESEQYLHIPSFEKLPNIALDATNRQLLSHRTANKITSYGIYTYRTETKEFIPIRSLHWEPQENQQSLLITEIVYAVDGAEDHIKQFSVSSTASGINKTDAQIAPYFNNASMWDLDSAKWDNIVIPDSDLLY